MAIEPIREGEPVRKFGQIIGFATEDIAPGDMVHTHNCRPARLRARLRASPRTRRTTALLPPRLRATFEGYRRANGQVGTRNYIGILTT